MTHKKILKLSDSDLLLEEMKMRKMWIFNEIDKDNEHLQAVQNEVDRRGLKRTSVFDTLDID